MREKKIVKYNKNPSPSEIIALSQFVWISPFAILHRTYLIQTFKVPFQITFWKLHYTITTITITTIIQNHIRIRENLCDIILYKKISLKSQFCEFFLRKQIKLNILQ